MSDTFADCLLPGVPEATVREILDRAGGNEIGSGKFASPESSAALAVNGFGWFLERPEDLPPFPPLVDLDWPTTRVDIERQMRFPWSGGRHPWLDAAVETQDHLIGVESKRYEPFRDAKSAKLSEAYDRDVWGDGMQSWCTMRDRLRASPETYRFLDAAQLVKHAFGLATEGRRVGKGPILLYLFAEPTEGRPIATEKLRAHRGEVTGFAEAVSGAHVRFAACSWREWLATFGGEASGHAARIVDRFAP